VADQRHDPALHRDVGEHPGIVAAMDQGASSRTAATIPSAIGVAAMTATHGRLTFLPHDAHATEDSGPSTHFRHRGSAARPQ
jgi:hypothetical protein